MGSAGFPITQTVIELISIVGVGNFILVAIVLGLIVNSPTIIGSISNIIKNRKSNQRIEELHQKALQIERLAEDIQRSVSSNATNVNFQTNEIKALVAIVDLLHSALTSESSERRDENSMITESLERLSVALESIGGMMRNVISEEDTSRLLAFILGIENSFRNRILDKAMQMADQYETGLTNGGLEDDLKNDFYSDWSDFRTIISAFNTPISITNLLDEKEKLMWEENGMFTEIIRIVKMPTDKVERSRKKEAIRKRLNIGLRRLHNDLKKHLKK